MKLEIESIDRGALTAMVRKASLVIETRNTIPILSYVRLLGERGGLTVRGTNLDQEVICHMPDVEVIGDVCLPAATFLRFLKSVSYESTIRIHTTKDDHIRIVAGKASCTLFPAPSTDYPNMKMGDAMHSIDLPEGALRWLITGVQHSISTEKTRYYLNGICLQIEGGDTLRATATNGHILSTVTQKLAAKCASNHTLILPRYVLAALIKVVDKKQVVVKFCESGKGSTGILMMSFHVNDVEVRTKLIDGTYPDWRRVVPTSGETTITLKSADMIRSLRPVQSVARKDRGKATKIMFTDGEALLETKSPDFGNAAVTLDCSLKGKPIEVGYNSGYLGMLTKAVQRAGSDQCVLSMNDAGSPTLIMGGDDERFGKHVIMPMRV